MRRVRLLGIAMGTVIGLSLLAGMLGVVLSPARTADMGTMAYAIQGPEDYKRAPVILPESAQNIESTLKAVAIVGEVGSYTETFINDVQGAVDALITHGVDVTTFYYGQDTFSWADIVTAAQGANFILYSGHGIYWGGSCANPTLVGGYYLGPQSGDDFGYVHPDDIRDDLGPVVADQAVALFTHACFSAGSTACDSSGSPGVDEASRRVGLYASAFIDAGFDAYFANNYYNSMTNYVNKLLKETERPTYGDAFLSTYPNSSSNYYYYDHDTTNAKWLNGSAGHWEHAFVGDADGMFTADQAVVIVTPELGNVPESVIFFYDADTGMWSQQQLVMVLDNIASNETLTLTLETDATWLTPPTMTVITPVTVTYTVSGAPELATQNLITITVESETPAAQDRFIVPVSLDVIRNIQQVFLPLVSR